MAFGVEQLVAATGCINKRSHASKDAISAVRSLQRDIGKLHTGAGQGGEGSRVEQRLRALGVDSHAKGQVHFAPTGLPIDDW